MEGTYQVWISIVSSKETKTKTKTKQKRFLHRSIENFSSESVEPPSVSVLLSVKESTYTIYYIGWKSSQMDTQKIKLGGRGGGQKTNQPDYLPATTADVSGNPRRQGVAETDVPYLRCPVETRQWRHS